MAEALISFAIGAAIGGFGVYVIYRLIQYLELDGPGDAEYIE